MSFTVGQRWISSSESQLGLGIITALEGRTVYVNFPAAEEERIYAADNAPLSRIMFKEGERVTTSQHQKIQITAVNEHRNLLLYSGIDESTGIEVHITEASLDCFIQLNTPQQRLFNGLIDKMDTYKLRIATLEHYSRLQQSKVRGLLGSRTSHLPHQVYIANEVAQRYAPRVLLADEVGLGKTIEAGMILHYQLHTGRAQKVLVVVPDSLIHQWLIEMRRRFNLYFSIIDDNRYTHQEANFEGFEIEESSNSNPFETESLVLCSLGFLLNNKIAQTHSLEVNWDLLIVDEAHHLQWSEEGSSVEYDYIEHLSTRSRGLLLLTATPEQVGIESHFARLRLLDPARFYSLAAFKNEEGQYEHINILVQKLLAETTRSTTNEPDVGDNNRSDEVQLDISLMEELKQYLGESISHNMNDNIKSLLDRHGTGRVLFRNTRASIQGFPERILFSYPLPCPLIYTSLQTINYINTLYPEKSLLENDFWLKHDPRVQWLESLIHEQYPNKILIICANTSTAISLEKHLKLTKGHRSSAFHEHLSLIERDRAAAYFAEIEQGAQVLVCSEIGSEGRNFQFAHHLVLFDLPTNPDLLEQRIGRLDRIGQKHAIKIHVPYIKDTSQEILFRWYHEGINLFTQSCAAAFSIYQKFEEQLHHMLKFPKESMDDGFSLLLTETSAYTKEITHKLQEGRDKLLELNSCNQSVAEELIIEIEAEENILQLETYMQKVFQEYGIDHEYHSEHTEVLRPTDHMKTSHFPGLREDGVTVTYSRSKGLLREDIEFLSWEHPMVNESIEMILNSELGNTSIATISIKNLPVGTLFLELFYTVNCAAPQYLQLDRFVPFTPIRILMDVNGKNLVKILDFNQLNQLCKPLKSHLALPLIKQLYSLIELILAKSNTLAELQMKEFLIRANDEMHEQLSRELHRLETLKKINSSIRSEEISFLVDKIKEGEHYINNSTLKLQALRVVVNK